MDEILQLLLGPFGTLVLSLTILFGGWKGWWVFGWHYRAVLERENEWKSMALRGTTLAEKVVEVVEKNGGGR